MEPASSSPSKKNPVVLQPSERLPQLVVGDPKESQSKARNKMREALIRQSELFSREEWQVLRLHYGLGGEAPISLRHAAGRLGLSSVETYRIVERAMRKLRRSDADE